MVNNNLIIFKRNSAGGGYYDWATPEIAAKKDREAREKHKKEMARRGRTHAR